MAKTKKRQAQVDESFADITGAAKLTPPAAEEPNPLGVKLTTEEIQALDVISSELEVNRHQVLQYAVRDFIARYKRGERPKIGTKTIITLETD